MLDISTLSAIGLETVYYKGLVFKHVLRFPVQPVSVGIDDFDVSGFVLRLFEPRQIRTASTFDEGRTGGITPIDASQQIFGQCDGNIEAHKIYIRMLQTNIPKLPAGLR